MRTSRIFTVAKREALQSLKSVTVQVVFALCIIGAIAMIIFVDHSVGAERTQEVVEGGTMLILLLLMVAMGMSIMMTSSLIGASVANEKDKKVAEVLLSAVTPQELYVGKFLGHGVVGLFQLILLWAVIIITSRVVQLVPGADMPWRDSIVYLVFFISGYVLFTALYAIAGTIIKTNEDYMVAQIPVLMLFIAVVGLPFLAVMGFVSESSTWYSVLSWIPPFTMGTTPSDLAFFDEETMRAVVNWLILTASSILLVWLGGQIFKKRILV